jgi:class 3 adenylate cyclase/predicted ATPase
MTFEAIVDQAIEMVQRRGRVTYRLLKRQFALDDAAWEDLKEELIYGQRLAVEEERVLVWIGDPPAAQPERQRGADAESRLHALLPDVMGLLQRERRVTYRRLTYLFTLDHVLVGDIREELALRRLAVDEEGKVLVWTGEAQPAVHPAVAPTRPPALPEAVTVTSPPPPELVSSITATDAPHDEPIVSPEALPTDTPQDEPVVVSALSRSAPEAERRQLTVMFCDLVDSTQLSQELDPEDLREVVRAYQATAAEVIQQYEGHMAQYLGDGLLIYFGWPVAHEDDAQRSLHAGLGIVEAITTTLNPRLEQEKGVQLTVRLGIHTGPVVVGEMGGGGRHENLATGETVNIAARLEGLAAPNTVLISHITARLVERMFALDDLGPHALKGVAEPMPVFRVLGPLEEREDETTAVGVPFLVGRDEEIGLLSRRWEQSKAGLGQVVLVSGAAGIGKSALVEVLRAHIRREGFPRITFHCSPYHQNSALYPVMTHLEHLLHFEREDTPAAKLDKLVQGLQTSSLPLDEVVPLLAALLSVPLQDRYAMPTLTPPQQKQQTFDALVAWLVDEAERQPLLVVWENLHWADPSTLELLELLLEQTPTVPMLSVLTFRPAFHPPWPMRSHMTPITLNRLERPQVEALITHCAGGKPLPDEVVQHIVAKTDGVPLYVEELTKMLLASELLREDGAQYVLTGPLLSVAIPDTLQDSLMARLDQLNTAKEMAQLGAVLGREFSYAMLQLVSSQDEATVQAGLAQLVEAELLYRRGWPPRATYRFKHALIQDAVYASLLRSTRQQVHQQVAQLMEARFPELVETQPELVAHHYTAGGCSEQAIGYWQQAGQRVLQRSANQEALRHLTTGLELLHALPETPARDQQELAVQMVLGPAVMAIKGSAAPEAEGAYTRARQLCHQLGEERQLFPVLWGLCRFYYIRAEYQTAREVGEQLLTLAQQEHDAARLLAAHQALGTTLYFLGEFTASLTHLDQGLALTDPAQEAALAVRYGLSPSVQCLSFSARDLWYLGYPDQGLSRSQEACRLAQELAHLHSLAYALYNTGRLHLLRGEVDAVQEQAEALVSLATEHKFVLWGAVGHFQRGWTLAMQGQGDAGLALMHQSMAAVLTTGAEVFRLIFLALLAETYGRLGQVEAGLHTLAEALAITNAREQHDMEAELHWRKGALLLQQAAPDASQAETCFQQALAIARHQEAKAWELRAATSLACLWQSRDKRQDAYDLLAPVYEWFTEGFDTADLQVAKTLLDELR